jgi:hypothetical protein
VILPISTRAIDALCASRFPLDHPDATEALTHPLSYTLSFNTRLARVSMHGDQWWAVIDGLRAVSVIEPGDWTEAESLAASAARAAARLAVHLERYAAHPAYRHLGVAGIERVALPAFRVEGDERLWPTRRQALLGGAEAGLDSVTIEAFMLHPELRYVRGRRFTIWVSRTQAKVG